jgi:N-acetylmuramic acid 6-phosphate etherase
MVYLKATNTKLIARTRRIVAEFTGLTEAEAEQQLTRAGGELKTAVVAYHRRVSPDEARRLLKEASGQLRGALTTDR